MEHWRIPVDGAVANVVMTDRGFGSVHVGLDAVLASRVVERPWIQAHQVHGADVLVVDDLPSVDATADVLVTSRRDVALAVRSADCATVAMVGDDGAIAAVHAGWRGLEAGAIGAAADALRAGGSRAIAAVVGPHIGVECYEFGAEELERLRMQMGDAVVGRTNDGRLALDVGAAVRRALDDASVTLTAASGRCTACADDLWSHRARGDVERQALVVWVEEP